MPKQPTKSDPDAVSEEEVQTLIEKLERDELTNEDKKIIAKVLGSYLFVARMLKESSVKIKNLRDFFLHPKKKNPQNPS